MAELQMIIWGIVANKNMLMCVACGRLSVLPYLVKLVILVWWSGGLVYVCVRVGGALSGGDVFNLRRPRPCLYFDITAGLRVCIRRAQLMLACLWGQVRQLNKHTALH